MSMPRPIFPPIIAKSFLKSSSFVNKNGSRPERIGSIIRWDKIVLTKEELTDDNWQYVGEDTEDLVKRQLKTLKFYDDGIPILEE